MPAAAATRPKGKTPVVGKAGRRFGCNVIQAVGNRGELWFRVFAGRFTQELFIDFLKRLLKVAAGRKLILIVDGHPAHRGRKATHLHRTAQPASRGCLPARLQPRPQPGRVPQQRHQTRRPQPPTADKLTGAARRHLHRRRKQPSIVQSFFRHPSVAYAT
jgi:hypothetical protein